MPMLPAIRQFTTRFIRLFRLWSCALLFVVLPLDLLYRLDSFLLYMTFSDIVSATAWMVLFLLAIAAIIALFSTPFSLALSLLWKRLRHAGPADGSPQTGAQGCITTYFLLFLACFVFALTFSHWVMTFQYIITIKTVFIALALSTIIYLTNRRTFHQTACRVVAKTWRFVPALTVFCVALAGWRVFSLEGQYRYGFGERAFSSVGNSAASRKTPDIILITFDALAAGDMSLHGYHLNTTPNLDAFARRCTVFDNAVAAENWTRPTIMSLMTGNYPDRHRLTNKGRLDMWPRNPAESLPALLKRAGYRNEAIVTNWFFAHPYSNGLFPWFDAMPLTAIDFGALGYGFLPDMALFRCLAPVAARWGCLEAAIWLCEMGDMANGVSMIPSLSPSRTAYPPGLAFSEAARHLDKKSATPRFLWLHIFVPHDPYLPPPPYGGAMGGGREFSSYLRQIPFLQRTFGPRKEAAVARLRLVYDEYIRYADAAFGDFLQHLRRTGRLDDSLIIVSADHGESFTHGYQGHGGDQLYKPLTQIPLLIHLPGQASGTRIAQTVSQTDIAPTILDLLGIISSGRMDGRSLAPLLDGRTLPPRPVFCMNLDGPASGRITKGSVAVIDDGYKYIRYLNPGREEMFDLRHDPDERINLVDRARSRADALKRLALDRIGSIR